MRFLTVDKQRNIIYVTLQTTALLTTIFYLGALNPALGNRHSLNKIVSKLPAIAQQSQENTEQTEDMPKRITRYYRLKYRSLGGDGTSTCAIPCFGQGSATGILGEIRKKLSKIGEVDSDPRTNQLIITDLPDRIEIIDNLISERDKPYPYNLDGRTFNNEEEILQFLKTEVPAAKTEQKIRALHYYAKLNYAGAKQLAFFEIKRDGWLKYWQIKFLHTEDRPQLVEFIRTVLNNKITLDELDFIRSEGYRELLPDLITISQANRSNFNCADIIVIYKTIIQFDRETGIRFVEEGLSDNSCDRQCYGFLLYHLFENRYDAELLELANRYYYDQDKDVAEYAKKLLDSIIKVDPSRNHDNTMIEQPAH